jgi:hypothetical protein
MCKGVGGGDILPGYRYITSLRDVMLWVEYCPQAFGENEANKDVERYVPPCEAAVYEAWQYLVDTDMVSGLNEWYGRIASSLISRGVIVGKA